MNINFFYNSPSNNRTKRETPWAAGCGDQNLKLNFLITIKFRHILEF